MMNEEQRLHQAATLLADWTISAKNPEENRLDVVVETSALPAAVTALLEAEWGYLAAITGLDMSPGPESMELLYHFCAGAAVVTLRVPIPRGRPRAPSLAALLPVADFFERELHEMLGIELEGRDKPQRLFLPDDWPEGLFPLRKDVDLTTVRHRRKEDALGK